MAKKSKNIQKEFRNTVFQHHQYWSIGYTERYKDGSEKDFTTFIKAKSYELAKSLLITRLKEDESDVKIKAVQGFMMHKDFKPTSKGRKLGIKEWDQIRSASFPNVHNVIFKHEIPRPEGYSNRFNKTNHEHVKTIGFKKGKDNWNTKNKTGTILPQKDRADFIYIGKWVKWDKALREHTKNEIISALMRNDNNRSHTCVELGYSRSKLYTLMKRFPEIDWLKEYPPPKMTPPRLSTAKRSELQKKAMAKRMAKGEVPFSNLTPEQESSRVSKLRKTKKAKQEERYDHWEPLIKNALDKCGNSRKEAAKMLGIKYSHIAKLMRKMKNRVNWAKEYPTPYSRIQK